MKTSRKRSQLWLRSFTALLSLSVTIAPFQSKSSAQLAPPSLDQDGTQSHRFFENGLVSLKNRNYQGAIAQFDQAIRIDPSFKEAYSGRGFAYLQLGQLDRAQSSYSQILQIDPMSASAYAGLALIRAQLGDDRQSQLDTAKSAALLARQTARHLYQGELSLLELSKVTNGQTPKSEVWRLIEQGYQQINAKNYRDAVNTFSQAVRLMPTGSARPYIDRGIAYFWSGDYRSAISDFSTAIRNNPNFAKAYDYRARAYEQIGQSHAAQIDRAKAIDLARQFGSSALVQEFVGKAPQAQR